MTSALVAFPLFSLRCAPRMDARHRIAAPPSMHVCHDSKE
jgi:hypothetical protein